MRSPCPSGPRTRRRTGLRGRRTSAEADHPAGAAPASRCPEPRRTACPASAGPRPRSTARRPPPASLQCALSSLSPDLGAEDALDVLTDALNGAVGQLDERRGVAVR